MEDHSYCPVELPVAQVARYAYADKYDGPDTFPEAVRRVVGVEPKRITTLLHDFVSPVLPTILPLTGVGLGVQATDRTGNAIDVLSIDGHIVVFGSEQGEGQNPTEQIRMAILQWNEDQSENPLTINTPILQDVAFPMAPYNYDLKGSFSVLWDCYVTLSTDPASPHFIQTVPVSLDLSGCPSVCFDGNVAKKYHMFLCVYDAHFFEPSIPPTIEVGLTTLFSDT